MSNLLLSVAGVSGLWVECQEKKLLFFLSAIHVPVQLWTICLRERSKIVGKRDGFSQEMREWVKERDGHQCVLCGATQNLEVHHVIPFRHAVTRGHGNGQGWHLRLVNSPINAVLLCRQDHRGSDDSVHPDAYLALKIYHQDKNSFTKMALKRDDLVRDGKVYWQTTHDLRFMEIALENTLKFVLAGNYPPW